MYLSQLQARKFALEAVCDSLRREIAPFGVRMVVVQTGRRGYGKGWPAVGSGIRPEDTFPPPACISGRSARLHCGLPDSCGFVPQWRCRIGSGRRLQPTTYPFQTGDPLAPELGIKRIHTGNETDGLGQE